MKHLTRERGEVKNKSSNMLWSVLQINMAVKNNLEVNFWKYKLTFSAHERTA